MWKPYDLCRVQRPDYAHAGEIISRPYKSDAGVEVVQVRRVVNDCRTVEEMPTSILHQLTYKPKYVHYATVSGVGYFPVDMLRYDYAAPVNFTIHEDDFGRITTTLAEGETELTIATVSDRSQPNWTSARWASFLWKVKPVSTLKITKGS